MPRRSHESLGDYISSACFGGVAFLSLLNGLRRFIQVTFYELSLSGLFVFCYALPFLDTQ